MQQALDQGHLVRAFVRRLDGRSVKLEKAGAENFVGQLSDFEDMSAALKGVKKAYFVAPWVPDQLHIAMNFAVAAAQSGLDYSFTG